MIPLSEHPTYQKYFKMLKVGMPREAVAAKMKLEGVNDVSMLDKDPSEFVPLYSDTVMDGYVRIKDHPIYSKYIKMLKVGLNIEAVKSRMQIDGFDPSILDKNSNEVIPLDVNANAPISQQLLSTKASAMLKGIGSGLAKKSTPAKIAPRRKKLFLTGIDASKVIISSPLVISLVISLVASLASMHVPLPHPLPS
jgi:hypothetical protein